MYAIIVKCYQRN